MYVEMEAAGKAYKLELTTRAIVQLEKDLGYNPLQMFMGIDNDELPKLSDMVKVLHRAIQRYTHGITLDDAYDIFDAYIADGHTVWDLIPVLINVFIEAGFLPKEPGDAEGKN